MPTEEHLTISKAELEQERTAKELPILVDIMDAKIRENDERKNALRLPQKCNECLKEFKSESIPLARLCEHYFQSSPKVMLKQQVGNQNYDAEVINDNRSKKSPLNFIEITLAHEGIAELLRMQKLNEDGHVTAVATGKKEASGKTITYIPEKPMASSGDTIRQKQIDDISNAIINKSQKVYPESTGLLVQFNDIDTSYNFKNDLSGYIESVLAPKLDNFLMLFIVGSTTKGTYLEFNLAKYQK